MGAITLSSFEATSDPMFSLHATYRLLRVDDGRIPECSERMCRVFCCVSDKLEIELRIEICVLMVRPRKSLVQLRIWAAEWLHDIRMLVFSLCVQYVHT